MPKLTDQTIAKRSVVKFIVNSLTYDYSNPWNAPTASTYIGSGFVIQHEGKIRLITNAHVADCGVDILVRLANDSDTFEAKALYIGHDCDLAMFEVTDPEFLKKVSPLEIGDLIKNSSINESKEVKEQNDKKESAPSPSESETDEEESIEVSTKKEMVKAYGFPIGGNELSITLGSVNRIEQCLYAHSGISLLVAQISASINPGNSGGPVLNKDNQVIGVVHQQVSGGQGLGYMIPSLILKRFLKDCSTGVYKGIPTIQFKTQDLSSEPLRKSFGMKKEHSGVLVIKVPELSAAHGVLKADDIILSINGVDIANDGMAKLHFSKRIPFDHLFKTAQMNDSILFKLLRDKQEQTVSVTLKHVVQGIMAVEPEKHGDEPTYFIASGMIFQPLTMNYIDDNAHANPMGSKFIPISLAKQLDKLKKHDSDQIIVLNRVLFNQDTKGYDGWNNLIVKTINGKEIHKMKEVVDAIEGNKEAFHTVITNGHKRLVLPKMDTNRHKPLLDKYRISCDRSRDLGGKAVDPKELKEKSEQTMMIPEDVLRAIMQGLLQGPPGGAPILPSMQTQSRKRNREDEDIVSIQDWKRLKLNRMD